MSIIDFILLISTSIFSICWCWILTDKEMILSKHYEWVKSKLEDKHDWLWYPLWLCPKCNSGQLSLWIYLGMHWNDYNLLYHIFYITNTIFITWLLSNYYSKEMNNK